MPLATSATTPANGPGIGSTSQAELAREAHEAEAGIADDRHAGVGDERDRFAARDPVGESARLLLLGVIVEAIGGTFDAEVREELARVARVFAEDEVRRLQRLDRARRKIAEVAERRADDEELAGIASSVSRGHRSADGSRLTASDR